MKMRTERRGKHFLMSFLAAALIFMCAGGQKVSVLAANGAVYTCQIVPCYAHPVTGVIEDSGGEAAYATGQGMVESALYTTGIIEVLQDGTFYLTIRLSLMDYTSGHSFWVQNVGDSGWSTPAVGVTATGSDSNGSTADVCIQVPSENCVVRGSMYVEPMGRDVVFYFYPTNYTEGNSTNMLSTMIVEDTPAAGSSGLSAGSAQSLDDGSADAATQTEAPLETEAALSADAADGTACAEAAMEEARGLRMSMDLETAKEETAAADGVKLVAASPQIATICEKLDLDLAGVCAEDASQVPERYQDVVITETEEQARLTAIAAVSPDWILDAASKKSERQKSYEDLNADWVFLNLDSVAGMYRSIKELGEIFGKEAEAQAVTEELGTFYDSKADATTDEKVAILVATKDGCVAATDASYLGDLIALAGGSCVCTDEESAYTELDLKELSALNADRVLRVSSGLSKEEADEVWKELEADEAWQSLGAVQSGAVEDLDADRFRMDADLSWQEALKALKEVL